VSRGLSESEGCGDHAERCDERCYTDGTRWGSFDGESSAERLGETPRDSVVVS
jgi:hypothetical protein